MILLLLFSLVLVLYAGRLFFLQIIDTDGNTDNTATYTTLTTVRAARGDILDRNGNVLVGNRASYDLVLTTTLSSPLPTAMNTCTGWFRNATNWVLNIWITFRLPKPVPLYTP